MNSFNIIWKFAVIGFLLSIILTLGKIEKQLYCANKQIKEYFYFEEPPLPTWEQ
jgi:hypothetical protein